METLNEIDEGMIQDFSDGKIVGFNVNRATSRVLLHLRKAATNRIRLFSEVVAQSIDEGKVLQYWSSQATSRAPTRECILECNRYHVYDILTHRHVGRRQTDVLVQWVGYPADNTNTTWEPLNKIRRVAPNDIHDYINANHLKAKLRKRRISKSAKRVNKHSRSSSGQSPALANTVGRGSDRLESQDSSPLQDRARRIAKARQRLRSESVVL